VTSKRFAARVQELGAEIVESPDFHVERPPEDCGGRVVACPDFHIDRPSQDCSGQFDENENFFVRIAKGTLSAAAPFYAENQPDILVYDFVALAGPILGRRLGIPTIQTSPVFVHDKQTIRDQVGDPVFLEGIFQTGDHLDHFLEANGVLEFDFVFHREKLNIYLFPKLIQPNKELFSDECFLFAGRCAGEQPYYGSWKNTVEDSRPIVLVSTSTTYVRGPSHFKMCLAALAKLPCHVILSIGDLKDTAGLLPLPPCVEIVRNVSHIRILPYVDLFICLGGIITEAEAAYHGVPLLILTYGFPELEWQARNIVRLGLGVHLPKSDTSVESLRASIDRMMRDDQMRQRVRDARRLVLQEPGAEETANRIEDFIASPEH
jgi:MGT family glycosyltransferase